ncbi:MAG: hypothetical protein JWQ90_5011 [Hydrocarboniphaga sp.]|uniref:hypothetical protein n=1 Tax=Hydrocarboniphaga sp. TaxID=2033016 RepID=UPI002613B3CD|nr:hypothetical protein [Hydrocarboniphaga sp.]MDB5972561.1 hypothetical protein [Hydrocarboniphaga sp.]
MAQYLEPLVAAFSATSVEFLETLVIAYAIGRAGYPREAITAIVVGHLLVAVAAIFLYPLHQHLPLIWLRSAAVVLLIATGSYWTWKSWRRLRSGTRPRWVDDPLGKVGVQAEPSPVAAFSFVVFLVMAKTSMVEAAEIAVFVLPIAVADKAWRPAIAGCVSGIVAVCLLAVLLHRQLRRIPEVRLKLLAGLVLTTMGLIWLVELI